MSIDISALRRIISDEERLLTGGDIPREYLSDALGRLHGEAEALALVNTTTRFATYTMESSVWVM